MVEVNKKRLLKNEWRIEQENERPGVVIAEEVMLGVRRLFIISKYSPLFFPLIAQMSNVLLLDASRISDISAENK